MVRLWQQNLARCCAVLCLALALMDSARTAEIAFEHPGGKRDEPIVLHGPDARWQLQVTGRQADQLFDATQSVEYLAEPPLVEIEQGFVKPLSDGATTITAKLGDATASINLQIEGMDIRPTINFPNQIIPIFTKLGCNGGGCHGKASGQAGFKLSLLGFEPLEDYEHLVHESRGRRLFPSVPDQSLLLLKAINKAPHGGGQRLDADSHEYRLLHRWIANGMSYGSDQDPHVVRIEVTPGERKLQRGQIQQLAAVAIYSDGRREDITRTAQYESNNTDLADVDTRGLVQLQDRSGDAAIMVRYQGQVSVFRASIPLGVEIAELPPSRNLIDEFTFAKLKTLGIPPSPECDDATFIRRVTLDLAGRLPTIEETLAFQASGEANKHEALVDRLLISTEHAEYFAKKWSAILRNRRPTPGHQLGAFALHDWLRSSFLDNKPYDQLVRELLTASGSIETDPAVAWYREVNTTEARVEDAAQLFLGQRLQCARCHHHPFEKWSQADYFHMAAFFSKVAQKEGSQPEEPVLISRTGQASARHPKSGKPLAPAGLDAEPLNMDPSQDPREQLADWMVAPENPFFASALVNRYWKHFFAIGMVEPEDDMRITNPPSNPALLAALSQTFIDSGYDLRGLLRLICTSTTYRLSSDANATNLQDTNSYSRYYPKRLQAEVLLDAINQVTQTSTAFAGMPPDTRAVGLPDTTTPSYFLEVFGRPDSATACECERSSETTLAQSLHLLNSKEVQTKLRDDAGRAAALAASSEPDAVLIEQLYLAALSRHPTQAETETAIKYLSQRSADRRPAFEDLVWALINSKEFLFNH